LVIIFIKKCQIGHQVFSSLNLVLSFEKLTQFGYSH